MKRCDVCSRLRPQSHFYPKSGKPRCTPLLKWPLSRRFEVMTLIERGKSSAQIAKALGTTENAIQLMRMRYQMETTKATRLTARQVAERMGVRCPKTVTKWIEAGLLKGKKGYKQGPHRVWLVEPLHLYDFISDESTWHVWEVERIADPRLRAHAQEVRGDIRFLTPREVAWEFYVEHAAINNWIRKGKLKGRKWGNWWIDEREVERLKQERAS